MAIIPARSGSKGIKNKNIKLLNEHPLLAYSIKAGLLSNNIDRVICSTDSKKIRDIARDYGAETPFIRPKNLNETQLSNLSRSIKMVSLRAYYQHGNTIDKEDFFKRFGNINNFRFIRHMVFNRKDQPCFYCSQTIHKIFQSSRRLYYCIECQA